jgi:hypothetical protein
MCIEEHTQRQPHWTPKLLAAALDTKVGHFHGQSNQHVAKTGRAMLVHVDVDPTKHRERGTHHHTYHRDFHLP